ncbi:MAG TPA: membrane dipeptidase [Vicinamibacteria bacterium]|nr:membrane dipeptidase [Vicinamibacteria bacterium]
MRRRAMTAATAICLLSIGLTGSADTVRPAPTEDAALRRARRLLKSSLLVDGHNDLPWAIRESKTAPGSVEAYDLRKPTPGNTDLARLREGGVGAQFWSVYIPGEDKAAGYARVQLEQIDIARRVIARYPDALGPALTAGEMERVWKSGKIASLLGIEGGHALENSLGALRAYYDLGVRYMTLTHSVTLDWADAAGDTPRHGGLTPFGEEVVREMNRLGMLVDLSHVTPETMDDALRVTEAPVIFSHSSAKAICDVPRNVPDDILRRLPANGGLVMVTFVPSFVSPEIAKVTGPAWAQFRQRIAGVADSAERERLYREIIGSLQVPQATVGQVADHIEHIRKVAGVDHLGLGGDYDGNDQWPAGLEDVSKYPNLFAELIRRGWSDADLKKLAGGNLLRVMKRAEAVSQRLRATRPASIATLAQLDGKPARQPLPDTVHWVRNSAEYRAIALQTYRLAGAELEKRAAGRAAGTWAVILDGDETVISNAEQQKEQTEAGLAFNEAMWSKWVERKAAVPIPGAVAFLDRARALGGRIAIVTNRSQADCPATEDNFKAHGIPYDLMLCKPKEGRTDKDARYQSVQKGEAAPGVPPLEVLMWVGDNIQDFPSLKQDIRLKGDQPFALFGKTYFAIPNPMYGSWEKNPRN